MKKTTLAIAICFTISGCADLNQHIEKTAKIFKTLVKKPEANTESPVQASPVEIKKTTPESLAGTATPSSAPSVNEKENPGDTPLDQKPTRLNFTLPPDITNTTNISAPAPAQDLQKEIITQAKNESAPLPSTLALAKPNSVVESKPVMEAKIVRASEHVSVKELNGHHWQINKIFITNNFMASEDHWLFSFNQNGQYKAFGACNYLSGKFKAADDGTFRLGKLETSLNDCPKSKDEEVMVFNMLLMADSFAMRDDVLLFKSGDKVMMELITSNQDINVNMSKKSHSKKDKKSAKTKSAQKKESKKKVSKKSLKENAPKDSKQKAGKSPASKSIKNIAHQRK